MSRLKVKERTYKATELTYTWTKVTLISLYIIGLFGLWSEAPAYLRIVDSAFNIIVSLTLIYFFNPFKKTICNDFHRKVVFSAGIAIFLQTSLMQYLNPITIFKKAIHG
jgi:hypothetical protein